MKRILITGLNSYIGTSFENYLAQNFSNDYSVDTVDMVGDGWREKSFAGYDVVFHVAGIAHQKETKKNEQLYFSVNKTLAVEVAKKAREDGVKQFIFLSSMSVYGMDTGIITKATKPNPKTNYGKSKLQAEGEIKSLTCEDFRVCILRPPMVYGDGCKGNYRSIEKIVKTVPFFPLLKNERSLIHVINLSAFVENAIRMELSGLYFPQDRNYVATVDLARRIAKLMGRRIYFSRLLGWVILLLRPFSRTLKKAFGNLVYQDTEDFNFEYCKQIK